MIIKDLPLNKPDFLSYRYFEKDAYEEHEKITDEYILKHKVSTTYIPAMRSVKPYKNDGGRWSYSTDFRE